MRRVPYKGSWYNERVLGDPEKRVSEVLNAPSMIGAMLVSALKPETPPSHSVDAGLTAAYLLSRTLVDKTQQSGRAQAYAALLERFDPTQIKLGSSRQEVEEHLGTPHIIDVPESGREMRYYGSVEHGLLGNRELMWLAVVYEEDKVIRVFSADFIDQSKIRDLEKKFAK
jgi:hypothetical protein